MALFPNSGVLVKTPSCDSPPKYGLLASVSPTTVSDEHWMAGGINFEEFFCGEGVESFIDECPPASGYTKPAERNNQFCAADPFVVVGSYDCSTGGRPASESFEIVRKRLLMWESFRVENTLWTGISSNGPINPSFAFGNSECGIEPQNIGEGLSITQAISRLEGALSGVVACGATIHMPYEALPYMAKHHLLVLENGSYYTPSGTKIVAGHGYPITGPANVASSGEDRFWLFATGPLVLVRSNVMFTPENLGEAVDRNLNNVTVRAERFYSVGFSCALFAAEASGCFDLCD